MVKVNKSKMTFKGRASISATFLIESVELKKRKRSQKSKDAKRVKTRKTVSEYSTSSTSPTSGPSWGQESNSSTDPQLSTPGPSRTSTLGVPSMGKSRKLSILPLLHREVMREYGDDELCGFDIHHSHVFIKLVSILNEKVFATFRNLENGFITLQKAWQFNKYNINKLEHGFSQHFTNKSEFPSPDFEVEEDLKKSIVSTDQSIRCNYPRCMCKGRVWPSRNAAHQHLQNVNVIYFCAACGQNFNARTTAVSHHRASCTYTKDGAQIEIIREINEIEKRKKRTKKKDENVDEFQNNDDTQDAEVNYGNFEPTISFDEFLKYCLELGVSQKVLDLSITIDEIKRKTSLEEKYILLSFLKTCKDLVLNQQNLKINPTKNDMRIFHSKKYAFQIVKRLNSEPISVWELEYLITNSIRQVSMDDQLKYYCHYLQCPCSGQFFSTNLHELTRHIQIRNFSLVCFVCNRAFNSQKLLDEHYLPECKLPSAWQPDTLKSKFLTTYMKKNNFE